MERCMEVERGSINKEVTRILLRVQGSDGGGRVVAWCDRIEPERHTDKPEEVVVDDDDDVTRVMGSVETRNDKTQTPIPSPLRLPRTNLSSDKAPIKELTVFDTPTIATSS
uniref:Uncharacterized protein n=1 Tax=Tanacetum cinerariifolium TaxID=118510 RepID=A0A6L2L3D6_TANCI|nr:hypothetical protein [Tanacetum cinerariifolium]